MKIGFLGNAAKAHVHRWAAWLESQGHKLVVFTDKLPPTSLCYDGIKLVAPRWGLMRKALTFKLSSDPYANNRNKWKVYKPLVDAEGPDILHAHEALAYGPMLARFQEYPRVLTPWGPDMELLAGPDQDAAQLVRQAVVNADVITTNAPGMEKRWAELAQIPEERFQLFPWGIDRKTFHPRPDEEQLAIRLELGIPPAAPVVLSPRLVKPLYQIDAIMRAWALARKNAPPDTRLKDGRLVILRTGASDTHWNERLYQARQLDDDSIIMVDRWLKPEHLAALYTTSSATMMAPKTDLLAMSLLESISCGSLPILAGLPCYRTACADLEEQPPDKAWAVFAEEPLAEGLMEALRRWSGLDDERRFEALAHNVNVIADDYDWEGRAKGMLEVYERVRGKCA